ncbi:hypothetical protein ACWEPN_36080 [Nonomuraea wenchangensis]
MRAAGVGLEFLTGELQGSHDPAGVVFTVLAALSGMEREYIRKNGKAIGGANTDPAMLSMALHLRDRHHPGQEGGPAPLTPAAVMHMLREPETGT